MNHQGTQTLLTDRLILRRFYMTDAEAMYRNWASDPEVTKFLMWQPHPSVEESRRILAEWSNHYVNHAYYVWAIVWKETEEPIGCISVNTIEEKTRCMTIGYCLGRAWWQRGIMTEAFRAVIRFLFEQVGVNRIEARHDPDNPASGAVMKNSGLIYEGTLRQAMLSNRGITDACMYSILKEEYDRSNGPLLGP